MLGVEPAAGAFLQSALFSASERRLFLMAHPRNVPQRRKKMNCPPMRHGIDNVNRPMNKSLLTAVLAAFAAFSSAAPSSAQSSAEQLTKAEVERIIAQTATQAMRTNPGAIIAVTDREGFVLGVWDVQGRIPVPLPAFDLNSPTSLRIYGLVAGAVTRAGTAAFLSSDQEALTTRTAGYITQQHFPPAVSNTPPGPLVGVGFSNLFFSDINRFKQIANPLMPALPFDPADLRASLVVGDPKRISPGIRGNPVLPGSLNDSPGGVPLYKNGHLVGGLGVTGDGTPTDLSPAVAIILGEVQTFATTGYVPISQADVDEFVALAGQTGFRPSPAIVATNILINGIRIPYVWQSVNTITDVQGALPIGSVAGRAVDGFPIQAPPPPYPYPVASLGGVAGELRGPVLADPGGGPGGVIRFIDDPLSTVPGRSTIGNAARLRANEVESIITKAAHRASITRAGIRLPIGVAAKVFITVVNNPDKALEPPTVLGTFRVGEATMFSWDVAVQKARTAVFSSNSQLAMSTRAVGFLSQRYYPPGIDGTPFGSLFGFQEAVSLKGDPAGGGFPGNPNLPNGITIFPGGFPLYRNGELIGAIGVSGDGVDQDDIIAASGCADFLADFGIRADSYAYAGYRMPYAKFPRNPVVTTLGATKARSGIASFSAIPGLRDLNGDGTTDFVFQNTAGQLYGWNMDGAGAMTSGGFVYGAGLGDWKLRAIADINNDGARDLIFQNTAGQIYVWYLDGLGNPVNFSTRGGLAAGSQYLYGGGLADWKIVACADLNGDGFPDLIFQNTAGQIYVWFLDGSENPVNFATGTGLAPGSQFLYPSGLGDWRVVACADVNNDGAADLLFQNNAGQIYAWFLDGTGKTVNYSSGAGLRPGSKFLYGGGLADWRIALCSDVNADGLPDLVFQNNIGQIYTWTLDGSGSAVDFTKGTGLIQGSRMIYPGALGDWRLR